MSRETSPPRDCSHGARIGPRRHKGSTRYPPLQVAPVSRVRHPHLSRHFTPQRGSDRLPNGGCLPKEKRRKGGKEFDPLIKNQRGLTHHMGFECLAFRNSHRLRVAVCCMIQAMCTRLLIICAKLVSICAPIPALTKGIRDDNASLSLCFGRV